MTEPTSSPPTGPAWAPPPAVLPDAVPDEQAAGQEPIAPAGHCPVTRLPGPGQRQRQPPAVRVTGRPWQGQPHAVAAVQRRAAKRRAPRRYWVAAAVAALAAGAVIGRTAAVRVDGHPAGPVSGPLAPPPLAACVKLSPVPCYAQDPLHQVYGTGALYRRGITGAGTTIAVIMPYANPWLRADLGVYCRFFRLPAARLQLLSWHNPPVPRPQDASAARWTWEGTADLELAHFMAPGARLVDVQIPASYGLYDIALERNAMTALAWLAARQQVDVVSFSYGPYEADIARDGGDRLLASLRRGLQAVSATGITIVAGSGDSGPTGPSSGKDYYPFRTVPWPTSDPLVTGVGGTAVHADARSQRITPDTVARARDGFAGGGGLSAMFARPAYQDRVASVVGDHRGVVDVSMDAAAWVYIRVPGLAGGPGWYPAVGTSISAPLFAGIVADAAQLAGHPLGQINPALYRMHGAADGVLDVTRGSNTDHGVPGFPARRGYDLPSGIGTVGNAALFVPALARLDQQTYRKAPGA